ncbi:MAG TPA: hypothetical protein VMQ76_00645 [Terracidiphilus sp.]|nr:hypothetical protein [Terracidiphilus sp.]
MKKVHLETLQRLLKSARWDERYWAREVSRATGTDPNHSRETLQRLWEKSVETAEALEAALEHLS